MIQGPSHNLCYQICEGLFRPSGALFFTLFNLQGTRRALRRAFILPHRLPFVKHFFQLFSVARCQVVVLSSARLVCGELVYVTTSFSVCQALFSTFSAIRFQAVVLSSARLVRGELCYLTIPFRLCQELFSTFFIRFYRQTVDFRSASRLQRRQHLIGYHGAPRLSTPFFTFFSPFSRRLLTYKICPAEGDRTYYILSTAFTLLHMPLCIFAKDRRRQEANRPAPTRPTAGGRVAVSRPGQRIAGAAQGPT